MSNHIVARVPHVHAEVIKAWADGAQVQFQFYATKEWGDDIAPQFHVERQYRVKPEPPAKAYPVTRMTADEMMSAWCAPNQNSTDAACVSLANAALRHAIDANHIISMNDHLDALDALGQAMKGVEITRHAARDMAIAEAVQLACYDKAIGVRLLDAKRGIRKLDLAAIIAEVRP